MKTLRKIAGELAKKIHLEDFGHGKYYVKDNIESSKKALVSSFERLVKYGGNGADLKAVQFNDDEEKIITEILLLMHTVNSDDSIFLKIIQDKNKKNHTTEEDLCILRDSLVEIHKKVSPTMSSIDAIPTLDEIFCISYAQFRDACYYNLHYVLVNMQNAPYVDQVAVLQDLSSYMCGIFTRGIELSVGNAMAHIDALDPEKVTVNDIVDILSGIGLQKSDD